MQAQACVHTCGPVHGADTRLLAGLTGPVPTTPTEASEKDAVPPPPSTGDVCDTLHKYTFWVCLALAVVLTVTFFALAVYILRGHAAEAPAADVELARPSGGLAQKPDSPVNVRPDVVVAPLPGPAADGQGHTPSIVKRLKTKEGKVLTGLFTALLGLATFYTVAFEAGCRRSD